MSNYLERIEDWFKLDYGVSPPIIITEYCKKGELNTALTSGITGKLHRILQDCKTDSYRIGIAARKPNRLERLQCKNEEYTHMFLLYKTTRRKEIFDLERHYLDVYYDNLETVRVGDRGEIDIKKINGY